MIKKVAPTAISKSQHPSIVVSYLSAWWLCMRACVVVAISSVTERRRSHVIMIGRHFRPNITIAAISGVVVERPVGRTDTGRVVAAACSVI